MEQQADKDQGRGGTPIIVNDTPMYIWDVGGTMSREMFLNSIDPTYFRYIACSHEAHLESDDSLNAAVALRIAYSHSIESLFALIGAAVQAPHCPEGWLLRYQNPDLKELLKKIGERTGFSNHLGLTDAGWHEVANILLPSISAGDGGDELRHASARLWESLAGDILDDNFADEYNSLKHGFRVRSGDWFLRIGREDVPGTAPPPERMRTMASSQFGSNFLRAVRLKKYQWRLEEQRVNWDPSVLAKRIILVADSIQNVLTYLKCVNDNSIKVIDVCIFDQSAVTEALHSQNHSSSVRFSVRRPIDPDAVPSLTKEEILADYVRAPELPSDPHQAEEGRNADRLTTE